MKKLIAAFILAVAPTVAMASGGEVEYDKAPVDLSNMESLQHGAKLFATYCLSCHSAQYMRFSRVAEDLGMSEDQVKKELMFTTDKIGSTMTIAMPAKDSKAWFGNPPPDLSVMARARGADYLYTYLRTFYIDEKKPTGVNNKVFPDVGMPHVLWKLEGLKKAVVEEHDGEKHLSFEMVTPGTMKAEEYDAAVGDLVNFMVYMGEPIQLHRKALGWKVLGFLLLFLVVSYLLKKEYWRDVH